MVTRREFDINRDWLVEHYITQKQTTRECAKLVGCCEETVRHALIDNEIPRRTGGYEIGHGVSEEIRAKMSKKLSVPAINISKEWLAEHYVNLHLSLTKCAKIYGCSRGTIQHCLMRNDIARRSVGSPGKYHPMYGKHQTTETKELISRSRSGIKHTDAARKKMAIQRKGYKNAFYGRKHSSETKRKLAEIRTGSKLSDATKAKISAAIKGENNYWYGKKGPLHPSFGKISKICGEWYVNRWSGSNVFLRSSYEKKVADYLYENCVIWEYEPDTFDLGDTTYTPDFYLPIENKYLEVKGWMRPHARVKIGKFRLKYPEIDFEIWDQPKLIALGILNKYGK
jgi:hypothetical protein